MDAELLDLPSILGNMPSSTNFQKLRKRLLRDVRQAMDDFGMVTRGDKWLVCLSGGKDSFTLLSVLIELQWRGLLPVELLACNLDQGQPGFPSTVLPEFLEKHGIANRIEYQDTYSVVTDKIPSTQTYCSLCSRLRRGHLYRIAREEGCQAVILGHHRDDMLETFFLNLFHGGKLASMPPKLVNDEGDLLVMRPLAYISEEDCARYAAAMNFPIIPCDLCGTQENLQRQNIKQLINSWEKNQPDRRNVMFKALTNINPSHMVDGSVFDFKSLDIARNTP